MKAEKVFAVVLLGLFLTVPTWGQSALISYQGKLTDSQGDPLNTTVSIRFSVYAQVTGGSALWTETQPSVVVQSGIFNVLLGSVSSFPSDLFNGSDRWLGIRVGSDAEMSPRQQIVSVGYALRAADADKLDGQDASEFGDGYSLDAADGNPTDVLYVNNTGNIGIGTTNPQEKLDVSGDVRIDGDLEVTGGLDPIFVRFIPMVTAPLTAEGVVYYNDNNDELYVYDGSVWQALIGGGGDNDWSGAGTGAMYATQTGDDVGIGTTTPAAKLHVNGTSQEVFRVTSNQAMGGIRFTLGNTYRGMVGYGDFCGGGDPNGLTM